MNTQEIRTLKIEWLLDCFEEEYDQETIRELEEIGLDRAINRYYDGGLKAFMRDL